MITLLEDVLERSDGSYISPQDLQALDRSFASWQKRRETYDLIQKKEAQIIDKVFKQFQRMAPDFTKRFTPEGIEKCSRDVILVLRYCATAMLLQDEELLRDRLLYWMQNIMQALRLQKINDPIYQLLKQVVKEEIPPENFNLILPYLKIAHEWLSQ